MAGGSERGPEAGVNIEERNISLVSSSGLTSKETWKDPKNVAACLGKSACEDPDNPDPTFLEVHARFLQTVEEARVLEHLGALFQKELAQSRSNNFSH